MPRHSPVAEKALAECRRLIGDEVDRDGRMWNHMKPRDRAFVARSAGLDSWVCNSLWADVDAGRRMAIRAALRRVREWAQRVAEAGEVIEMVM